MSALRKIIEEKDGIVVLSCGHEKLHNVGNATFNTSCPLCEGEEFPDKNGIFAPLYELMKEADRIDALVYELSQKPDPEGIPSIRATLDDVKKWHVERVLSSKSGNKMASARVLGVNVKTLYNLLHKYKIITKTVIASCLLFFCGCDLVSSDPLRLKTEIDTKATVTWNSPILNADGTELTDLAGFKVIHTDPSGIEEEIEVGNVNEFVLENLSSGIHAFSVVAYDTSGNISERSEIVSKIIQ